MAAVVEAPLSVDVVEEVLLQALINRGRSGGCARFAALSSFADIDTGPTQLPTFHAQDVGMQLPAGFVPTRELDFSNFLRVMMCSIQLHNSQTCMQRKILLASHPMQTPTALGKQLTKLKLNVYLHSFFF